MCDQTQVEYKPGDVVWFKISNVWWPAQVQDENSLEHEITRGLKKKPFAIVKFFNEDLYEFVKDINQICHYNSYRKFDFIKKGLYAFRTQGDKNKMNKFPSDVVLAEEYTGGNINILDDPRLAPEEKVNYNDIFSSTKKIGKNAKAKSKHSLVKSKLFMGSTSSPFSFRQDFNKSNNKNYFTEVRLQNKIECFPIEFKCDACDFMCSRLSTLSAHKAYNKQNSCANKSPLKFSKTQSFMKFEKSPIKRKSVGNEDSIKKKPKVSLKGVAPENKKVKSVVKDTKDKKKSEAMREQLLLDWNEEDADDYSDVNTPKSMEKGENKSETSNKTSKELINKTSCFDFEDNEEDINVNSPYRFGQKLPRIISAKDEKTKVRELKFKDIKTTSDDDTLEKEFNDIMKDTSVPVVPMMTDSFLLDSSALPVDVSAGKAEANLGSTVDVSLKKDSQPVISSSGKDSLETKCGGGSSKVNTKNVEDDNSSLLRTLESDSPAEDDISTNSSAVPSGKRLNSTINEKLKKKLKRDINLKDIYRESNITAENNNSLLSDKDISAKGKNERKENKIEAVTTIDEIADKTSLCVKSDANFELRGEISDTSTHEDSSSKNQSRRSSRYKPNIKIPSCSIKSYNSKEQVTEPTHSSLEKKIDNPKSEFELKRRDSLKKDKASDNKEKCNKKVKVTSNSGYESDMDKKIVDTLNSNKGTGNDANKTQGIESKKQSRKTKKSKEFDLNKTGSTDTLSSSPFKNLIKDEFLSDVNKSSGSEQNSSTNNSFIHSQEDSQQIKPTNGSSPDSKKLINLPQQSSSLDLSNDKSLIKKVRKSNLFISSDLDSALPQASEKILPSSSSSQMNSLNNDKLLEVMPENNLDETAEEVNNRLKQSVPKGSTESLKISPKKLSDEKNPSTSNDIESTKSKSKLKQTSDLELDHSQMSVKLSASRPKRKSADHKLLKNIELNERSSVSLKSPKKKSTDHSSPRKSPSNLNSSTRSLEDLRSKKLSDGDSSFMKLPIDPKSPRKAVTDQVHLRKASVDESSSKKMSYLSSPRNMLAEESSSKKPVSDQNALKKPSVNDISSKKSSEQKSLKKSSVDDISSKKSSDQSSFRKSSVDDIASKKTCLQSSPRKTSIDETSSKKTLTDSISPKKTLVHDSSKKAISDQSFLKKTPVNEFSYKKAQSGQSSLGESPTDKSSKKLSSSSKKLFDQIPAEISTVHSRSPKMALVDEILPKKLLSESKSIGKVSSKSNDKLTSQKLNTSPAKPSDSPLKREQSLVNKKSEKLSTDIKFLEKHLSRSDEKISNNLKSSKTALRSPEKSINIEKTTRLSGQYDPTVNMKSSDIFLDQISSEKVPSNHKPSKKVSPVKESSMIPKALDGNKSPTLSTHIVKSESSCDTKFSHFSDDKSSKNLTSDVSLTFDYFPSHKSPDKKLSESQSDKSNEKSSSGTLPSPDKECKKLLCESQPSLIKPSEILKSPIHNIPDKADDSKAVKISSSEDITKLNTGELSHKYSSKPKESSDKGKAEKSFSFKSKDKQDSHSRSSTSHRSKNLRDSHSSRGESSSKHHRTSSTKSSSSSSSSSSSKKDKKDYRKDDKYRSRREHDFRRKCEKRDDKYDSRKSRSDSSSSHHKKKDKQRIEVCEIPKSSHSSLAKKINSTTSFDYDSLESVNNDNTNLKNESSTAYSINDNICSSPSKKESVSKPSLITVDENRDEFDKSLDNSKALSKESKFLISENSSSNDAITKEMEEIFNRKPDIITPSVPDNSDKGSDKSVVSSVELKERIPEQADIVGNIYQLSTQLNVKTDILSPPVILNNICDVGSEPQEQSKDITIANVVSDEIPQINLQTKEKRINLATNDITEMKKDEPVCGIDGKSSSAQFNHAADIHDKIYDDNVTCKTDLSFVEDTLAEENKLSCIDNIPINEEIGLKSIMDSNQITDLELNDKPNQSSKDTHIFENNSKPVTCLEKTVEHDTSTGKAINYFEEMEKVRKSDLNISSSETADESILSPSITGNATTKEVDSSSEVHHVAGINISHLKFDFDLPNEPNTAKNLTDKFENSKNIQSISNSELTHSALSIDETEKSSNACNIDFSFVDTCETKSDDSKKPCNEATVEDIIFSDDCNNSSGETDFNSKLDIASEVVISSEPDETITTNVSKNPVPLQDPISLQQNPISLQQNPISLHGIGLKSVLIQCKTSPFSDIKLNLQLPSNLQSSINVPADSASNIQAKVVSADFLTPDKIKEIFQKEQACVSSTQNSSTIRPIIVPSQAELEEKSNSQPAVEKVSSSCSSLEFSPPSCAVTSITAPSQDFVSSDVQNMEFDINSMPIVIADSSEIISSVASTTSTPLPIVFESIVPTSTLPSDSVSSASSSLNPTEPTEKTNINCVFIKLAKPNSVKPGPGYRIFHIPRKAKPHTAKFITSDMIKLKTLSSHVLQKNNTVSGKFTTDALIHKKDGNRIYLVSKSGSKTFLINERTALLNHFSPKDLIVTIPSSEAGTSGKSKCSEMSLGTTKKINVGNFIQKRVIITNKNQAFQSSNVQISCPKPTNLSTQKKLVGICKAPDAPESSPKKVVRFKDPEIANPLRTNTILTTRRRPQPQIIEQPIVSNPTSFNLEKPLGITNPGVGSIVKTVENKPLTIEFDTSEKICPTIKIKPHQDILAKALADTDVLQSENDQTAYMDQSINEESIDMVSTVSVGRTVMSTTEVPGRVFSNYNIGTVCSPGVLTQSSMPLLSDDLQSQHPSIQLNSPQDILASGNFTEPEQVVAPEQTFDISSTQLTANVDLAEIELPPGRPPDSTECHDISSIPLPPEPYMGNRALISSPTSNNLIKQFTPVHVPQFPSNPIDSIHSPSGNS